MTHPLQSWLQAGSQKYFLALAGFSIVIMVVMNWVGIPLNTPAAPMGIVSFEIAGTPAQAQAMLKSWSAETQIRAAFIQGLDFLFPIVYANAVALGCLLAGGVLARRRWPLSQLGAPLAWGLWAAAGFDYIENISLVVLLFGGASSAASPWPQVAYICAMIKFGLLFLGLVYSFFGLAVRLVPAER